MAIGQSTLEDLEMTPNFWQGKRVFLTGHTGFKGSWMSLWLHSMGAKVQGFALAPATQPSLFELTNLESIIDSQIGNIHDYAILSNTMQQAKPDIVFHLAAQPLVRESYINPIETYQTNVMGTLHVLEAIRHTPSVKSVVVVTTDKCYENKEWVWPYRENEPMGGHDPYSSSKGCAELLTASYRHSFFDTSKVGLATARAGNVIGGGDFSKDRLIPDFIRAISQNETVKLRYPNAIRPWQHVLESIHGYLLLAEKLWDNPKAFSEAWNFGPHTQDTKTVSAIIDTLTQQFKQGAWQQELGEHPHEAHFLKLDIQKAETLLNWHPTLNIESALAMICEWYQAWNQKQDMLEFTLRQIHSFCAKI
jgi:CDP-glucose 4,6-dehydratase